MTRTGLSPRLGSHIAEPFVSIHPIDAERFGLADGGLARIANHHGAAIYRVVVSSAQQRGAIFVPMHWNDETASAARTNSLVHAIVDPFSGQPDLKATPVTASPVDVNAAGFILSRRRFDLPRSDYWAWTAISDGYAARIDTASDGADLVECVTDAMGKGFETLLYRDQARGVNRAAFIRNDRLVGAIFLGPVAAAPKWSALAEAWNAPSLDRMRRRVLLSGKRHDGKADEGPNVCACFGVPRGQILAAIQSGAVSTEAIGAKLKAGTNCGSCLPELRRLIVEAADAGRVKQQGVS